MEGEGKGRGAYRDEGLLTKIISMPLNKYIHIHINNLHILDAIPKVINGISSAWTRWGHFAVVKKLIV